MPRFFAEVDFTSIPVANFVAESSSTPPTATPRVGFVWNDTSITDNAVMKYWDGTEWVRMDGGGDIPNGMIVNRHIADDANIDWSKINKPANLATTDDLSQTATTLSNSVDTRIAEETARATGAEGALGTRIDNLGTSLTGSYVTLNTTQTVTADKTFTGNVVVPVGDQPAEAVRLSQLTAEATARAAADTGLDTRLAAVETATQDVNNATQAELDTLTGRVTAAEGVNTTQTANIGTVTTGLATEVTARGTADTAIRTDFGAADTALGTRITDETAARTAGDTTNGAAITAETTRATGAEGALGTRITDETTARTDGDTTNADAITAEVDRATGAEGGLADDIAAEATRAGDIEAGLRTDVNGLRTDVDAVDDAIATAVGVETDRATTAENALDGRLDTAETALGTVDARISTAVGTETTRATGAEDDLGTRIDGVEGDLATETTNRTGAAATERTRVDGVLATKADLVGGTVPLSQLPRIAVTSTRVVADTNARDALVVGTGAGEVQEGDVVIVTGVGSFILNAAGDWVELEAPSSGASDADLAALQAELDQEGLDRAAGDTAVRGEFAAADTALGTRITNEATARTNADSALDTRVAALEGVDYATQAELDAAIATEQGARGAADTALGGRIDGEATARTAGDATNATALATETTRATGAETALGGRIDGEVTARTSGDSTNATNITNEATTARAAEAALGTRIDTETAARIAGDDENAGALADEVTRATAAEDDLSGRITTEVADRGDADAAIRDDFATADGAIVASVTAEVTRATGAEGTLTTNLATEATTRGTADTALGGRIDGVEGDLATEVTRATGVEGGLDTRVTTLESAGTTAATDLTALTGRVTGTETVNSTQNGRLTALETADTTIRGEFAAADAALQTAIDAEVTARTSAVSDEVTARGTADTALGGRIDTEVSNRTSADTALGGRIDAAEAAATAAVAAEATARTTADTSVRADFATADTLIRADFATADATVAGTVTTERNRAIAQEAAIRSEFAAADTAAATAASTALASEVTRATGAEGTLTTNLADEVTRATGAEGALTSAAATETTRVNSALALKADLVDGKVPTSQLPALALTNVSTVDDIAGRDALTPDEGDVAVVADNGSGVRATYIYDGSTWVPMSSPADVTEAELAAAVSAGLGALRTELIGDVATVNTRVDNLGAGAGLTRTGDTFDVVGTAGRISVGANSVDIATDYVGQASITTVGTVTTGTWEADAVALEFGGTGYGASSIDDLVAHLAIKVPTLGIYAETLTDMVSGTPTTVTHNLGGEDVVPSLRQVNGANAGEVVYADVTVVDENSVTVLVDPSHDEAIDIRITLVGGPVGEDGRGTASNAGRAWS